jgi:hypothetical protein
MKIGETFKRSFEVLTGNLKIIFPSIFASLLISTIIFFFVVKGVQTDEDIPAVGFGVLLLNFLVYALTQGVTISMASDAIKGERVSFIKGLRETFSRLWPLTVAGIIVGGLIAIGRELMVFPALVVMYLFMFTFVIIMREDSGALSSLITSVNMVKENLKATFLVFVNLLLIAFFVSFLRLIIVSMPVLGPIFGLILLGGFMAFVSIVLLKVYDAFRKESPAG